jgi:hypothetical protein
MTVLPSSGVMQNLGNLLFWDFRWNESPSGDEEGKHVRHMVITFPKMNIRPQERVKKIIS